MSYNSYIIVKPVKSQKYFSRSYYKGDNGEAI